MSNSFWKSLPIRTGFSISLGAILLTLLLSFFFYNRTYQEQLAAENRQLQQLVATVENSAAIAAYLDNKEMAQEVVRGLESNDIVSGVLLNSSTGMKVSSGVIDEKQLNSLRHFPLASPFLPGDKSGEILIHPNQQYIEHQAGRVALVNVLTMAALSLALVVMVIVVMLKQLTQPLKNLAESLHGIEPGSAERLACPRGHEEDEICQLVQDTNFLLNAMQNTLEGERRLRLYAETLEKRFRLIFENASCGIALVNPQGKIVLFNPSFQNIAGEVPGVDLQHDANFFDIFENPDSVREVVHQAQASGLPLNSDLKLLCPNTGQPRWMHGLFSSVKDEYGSLLVEGILYDISERAEREQQALFEAERDPLTQLYNRRAGERHIKDALQVARVKNAGCALMLIDLDRFKPINDTFGHDAGDKVLVTVAQRLRHTLRKNDVVIRWGGDEFLIMVLEGSDANSAGIVAEKILQHLGEDIDIGEGRCEHVGASIGIALYPSHGMMPAELIEYADRAMYQAKQRGRNGFIIYADEQTETPPE